MFSKKEIDLNLRSKPDFWTKSIHRFATFSWCLTLIAVLIACLSIPVLQKFLKEALALEFKKNWQGILIQIEFCLFAITFLLSTTGLIINSSRHRRRTDKIIGSLVFFPIFSAICIIAYLIILF